MFTKIHLSGFGVTEFNLLVLVLLNGNVMKHIVFTDVVNYLRTEWRARSLLQTEWLHVWGRWGKLCSAARMSWSFWLKWWVLPRTTIFVWCYTSMKTCGEHLCGIGWCSDNCTCASTSVNCTSMDPDTIPQSIGQIEVFWRQQCH